MSFVSPSSAFRSATFLALPDLAFDLLPLLVGGPKGMVETAFQGGYPQGDDIGTAVIVL